MREGSRLVALKNRGGTWPCKTLPGGCPCRCHALVAGRARSKRKPRADAWLPVHDTLIRERILAGDDLDAIAAALVRAFHIPRTPAAAARRITHLGLSRLDGYLIASDLAHMLGVCGETIRRWAVAGRFGSIRWGGHRRQYSRAAVEAFVREQAGVTIRPSRIRDQRLRSLAETSAIVNRRKQSA